MTRIATGMTLLLLLAAAGCGGDDNDGGSVNPFSPTGVTSSAPMDTTNAQSGGGLTRLTVAGVRSAKPDKNTVDFSGVSWKWNAARSHLEPGSFPDARVNSGSNVWHRDSGTGLIRIFSDSDLSGMSFKTAGSSWPLSMRRAGLYVSDISGADVGGPGIFPLLASLSDTQGAVVNVVSVKIWSSEVYVDASYSLRPAGRIEVHSGGTYEVRVAFTAGEAPAVAVEAMARTYAWQNTHRPTGRSLSESGSIDPPRLQAAVQNSGAAGLLRQLRRFRA